VSPADGASLTPSAPVGGDKRLVSPGTAAGGRAIAAGGADVRGVEDRGRPGVVVFALGTVFVGGGNDGAIPVT
jgi:hypothetical protein